VIAVNIAIKRLDPKLPDPVESRRRAAGRLVRLAYASSVFGVLAFFVVYFGAPLVFLSGPGTVSSARRTVSLPYLVQVRSMNVLPGAAVKAGDEIAQVLSPEHDNIVAGYMRALADIASRRAELRIRARVAQESIATARDYQATTEKAADYIAGSEAASMVFRLELLRERAAARKAVVSQEAEISEAITQLSDLDEFDQQLREHLNEVEQGFAGGRIVAPASGIVSTNIAQLGQSLVAGTPIAEILDPTKVFVDWYIPNARLIEPEVGNEVFVLFGNARFAGKISAILRVSEVFAPEQSSVTRERVAPQIARVRLSDDAEPPALNSTVSVHMFYSNVVFRIATGLSQLLGILRS
jgi:hypothetical protein